jgi:hypothetical protein
MTASPDPLVVARLQKIGETTDGPSLVQAYLDLLTFGPNAFTTVLAFAHGEIELSLPPDDPAEARRAVLGVLAWLGHRYPDELFDALGDPRDVTPSVACTIEPIDDPRTAPILLAAVGHDDDAATAILLPALVRRRDERVVPLLERALFSTNRALRVRAAEGLYVMGRPASANAMRPALAAEPDGEVRAILTDALARAVDPSDDRDLSWFWVVVRPRLGEYGVAALDADDALTVLACVRYAGREAPTARSITDLVAEPAPNAARKHPIGLPAFRGMWAPADITVWRQLT